MYNSDNYFCSQQKAISQLNQASTMASSSSSSSSLSSVVSSIYSPTLFTGRLALISGGGTGIGLRTAIEFLSLGGSVIICSRKVDVLQVATNRLIKCREKLFPSGTVAPLILHHVCNIRDQSTIDKLIDFIHTHPQLLERHGYHVQSDPSSASSSSNVAASRRVQLDYLINNAGGQFPSPAADIAVKGWNAVIDTNLNGTFQLTKAIYNQFFVHQQSAAIVNVVANMHNGFPGMSHTGAARAGVVNLTKSLAIEWSHVGVRVNAIAPGVIDSSGLQRYDQAIREGIFVRGKGTRHLEH